MFCVVLKPSDRFMPLYKLTQTDLQAVASDSMSNLGIRERQDLQRVLKDNIDAIAPDTLVISEEFSEWQDSRRRIDLLGIDTDGNLVVIELKRTADGGHMDLQSIRYAAMVSALTFDRIVNILEKHLLANNRSEDAEKLILDHLGWDSEDEGEIASQTRIILVSEGFGPEITTTVLWLNEQGLDLRCVRMIPYKDGPEIFLDVQQIIPLPEASEYIIKIREKADEKKTTRRRQKRDLTRFVVTIAGKASKPLPKRRTIYALVFHLVEHGISPEAIQHALGQRQRFFKIPAIIKNEEEFLEAVPSHLALNQFQQFTPNRWFTADQELLQHEGATYSFHNQWGTKTEEAIKRILAAFPDREIQITKG